MLIRECDQQLYQIHAFNKNAFQLKDAINKPLTDRQKIDFLSLDPDTE